VAPFLVWTERCLWDATFALPIGMLALAAYASFLRTRSGTPLTVAVIGRIPQPADPPDGLPLFVALIGHMIWRHRDSLAKYRVRIGASLGVLFCLNAAYFVAFVNAFIWQFSALKHGYPNRSNGGDILGSICGPFLGGRILNGDNNVIAKSGLPGPAWWAPRRREYRRGDYRRDLARNGGQSVPHGGKSGGNDNPTQS